MKRLFSILLLLGTFIPGACRAPSRPQLVVSSKFFTEQVVLAEFRAQHIEARTSTAVRRKSNLGRTLLVQKARHTGDVHLYCEYTGTALTAVTAEEPEADAAIVYQR